MATKLKAKDRNIVDRYAALALRKREIESELNELRPVVMAIGGDLLQGNKHILTVSSYPREALSVPLAKAVMTAAQISEATVVQDITVISVEK